MKECAVVPHKVRWPRLSGWRRALVELVGLVLGAVVFSWLHNLAGTDIAAATANAHSLQSIERSLKVNVELSANQWLAHHQGLAQAATLYYRLYYLPLAGVFLWVLFGHPRCYLTIRRTLVVMAPLALVIFWLVPMSPPRFALAGVVDIVAQHDILSSGTSRDLTNGQNHFSAMPSLHVGWSALCAYAAWLTVRTRHPGTAWLAWLFPIVMVAVVIATGNHYVLDVIGSVVLLTISIGIAAVGERYVRSR